MNDMIGDSIFVFIYYDMRILSAISGIIKTGVSVYTPYNKF